MRLAARLVAALALVASASAAAPTKPVRAGHVAMRLPVGWSVRRDVGPLLLVAVAPRSAGGRRANVTLAEAPRAPGETLRTWRNKLIRGLSALPDGLRVRTRYLRLPAGRALEVSATGASGSAAQALMYGIQTKERAVVVVFTAPASAWSRRAPLFRALAHTLRISR